MRWSAQLVEIGYKSKARAIYAVLLQFTLFCRDLRAFVAKIVLSRFTHFCVEKNLTQNYICGEKMTNIRYGPALIYDQ